MLILELERVNGAKACFFAMRKEAAHVPITHWNNLMMFSNGLYHRGRVTGQKNVADYIIRHGPYAIFHDPTDSADEILARFQNVSIEALNKEQAAFHAATRCPRNIRSFRRDPQSYLNKLEALWLEDMP